MEAHGKMSNPVDDSVSEMESIRHEDAEELEALASKSGDVKDNNLFVEYMSRIHRDEASFLFFCAYPTCACFDLFKLSNTPW